MTKDQISRSQKILVVDDEPMNLAALKQILGDDYQLVYARSGTEALAATSIHTFSLILLDIQMPDMDGFEVCKRLKADQSTEAIPVIFVTSLADCGDEAAGFAVGAVDYIIKPISPTVVHARVRTHLSLIRATLLEQSHREAIYMLGDAGHYNDNDTGVHIWRMASYSACFASKIGWSPEHCLQIELSAAMHDTGKIGILNAILRKPGKLDSAEWEIMKTHSRVGYEILSKSRAPVFTLAAEIALYHHERYDGSGYPCGLVGDEIPESARIIAVCDVFDALTMKRPYKDAWPLERALVTIREDSGSHFDPQLVDIFMSILPEILVIKKHWDAKEVAHATSLTF